MSDNDWVDVPDSSDADWEDVPSSQPESSWWDIAKSLPAQAGAAMEKGIGSLAKTTADLAPYIADYTNPFGLANTLTSKAVGIPTQGDVVSNSDMWQTASDYLKSYGDQARQDAEAIQAGVDDSLTLTPGSAKSIASGITGGMAQIAPYLTMGPLGSAAAIGGVTGVNRAQDLIDSGMGLNEAYGLGAGEGVTTGALAGLSTIPLFKQGLGAGARIAETAIGSGLGSAGQVGYTQLTDLLAGKENPYGLDPADKASAWETLKTSAGQVGEAGATGAAMGAGFGLYGHALMKQKAKVAQKAFQDSVDTLSKNAEAQSMPDSPMKQIEFSKENTYTSGENPGVLSNENVVAIDPSTMTGDASGYMVNTPGELNLPYTLTEIPITDRVIEQPQLRLPPGKELLSLPDPGYLRNPDGWIISPVVREKGYKPNLKKEGMLNPPIETNAPTVEQYSDYQGMLKPKDRNPVYGKPAPASPEVMAKVSEITEQIENLKESISEKYSKRGLTSKKTNLVKKIKALRKSKDFEDLQKKAEHERELYDIESQLANIVDLKKFDEVEGKIESLEAQRAKILANPSGLPEVPARSIVAPEVSTESSIPKFVRSGTNASVGHALKNDQSYFKPINEAGRKLLALTGKKTIPQEELFGFSDITPIDVEGMYISKGEELPHPEKAAAAQESFAKMTPSQRSLIKDESGVFNLHNDVANIIDSATQYVKNLKKPTIKTGSKMETAYGETIAGQIHEKIAYQQTTADKFPEYQQTVDVGRQYPMDASVNSFQLGQSIADFIQTPDANRPGGVNAEIAAALVTTHKGFKYNDSPEALKSRGLSDMEVAAYQSHRNTMQYSAKLWKEAMLAAPPENIYKAIMQTTDKNPLSSPAYLEYAKKIEEQFIKMSDVKYAPLNRYGNHVISAEVGPKGEPYLGFFESVAERNKKMAEFEKAGVKYQYGKYTDTFNKKSQYGDLPDNLLVEAAIAEDNKWTGSMAEVLGAEGDTANAELKRRYGKIAAGFKRHTFERKLVDGYSTDFQRSDAEYLSGLANFHAQKLAVNRFRRARVKLLESENKFLLDRHDDVVQYQLSPENPISTGMKKLGALWHLTKPSTGLYNLTSSFTITPVVAAKEVGFVAGNKITESARLKAIDFLTQEFAVRKGWKKENTLLHSDPELYDALKTAKMEGILGDNITRELSGRGRQPLGQKGLSDSLQDMAFFTMSTSEGFNKVHGYITGYDIARAKDMNGTTEFAFQQIPARQAFANKFTERVTYDYSKSDRNMIGRGYGGVMTQFRTFQGKTINLMRQYGFKDWRLWDLLTRQVIVGGLKALPFAAEAISLANISGYDPIGYLRSLGGNEEEQKKNADYLNMLIYGPLIKTGLNLSPGVAMGVTGEGFDKGVFEGIGRMVAGPLSDIPLQWQRAAAMYRDGMFEQSAIQTLPPAIRNALKGMTASRDRTLYGSKNKILVDNLTNAEIGLMSLGLQPERVALAYEKQNQEFNLKDRSKENENITVRAANWYVNGRRALDKGNEEEANMWFAKARSYIQEVIAMDRDKPMSEKVFTSGEQFRQWKGQYKRMITDKYTGRDSTLKKAARPEAEDIADQYPGISE